jgi:hypothetical protein
MAGSGRVFAFQENVTGYFLWDFKVATMMWFSRVRQNGFPFTGSTQSPASLKAVEGLWNQRLGKSPLWKFTTRSRGLWEYGIFNHLFFRQRRKT